MKNARQEIRRIKEMADTVLKNEQARRAANPNIKAIDLTAKLDAGWKREREKNDRKC